MSEHDLARALRRLLREDWNKPFGSAHPSCLRLIQRDRALGAFFDSVAEAGDEAWRQEAERVRQRQIDRHRERRRLTGEKTTPTPELSLAAITDLLPLWRSWGWMLLASDAHRYP